MGFSSFFKNFGSGLLGAASGIFNGIGNVVSTYAANKSNQRIAQLTNESNERINQSILDYNWQMWNAENEYNNPAAVRKRLTDAGLNPIYYGLDGNPSAVGQSYSPIASQQASPTIPNDLSSFGDSIMRAAQIRNIEADTQNKKSSAGLADAKTATESQLLSGQIEIQGQIIQLNTDEHNLNGKRLSQLATQIDSMKQSMDESKSRIADLRSQMSMREFQKKISSASLYIEAQYKKGLIDLQEKQLAISWFNAFTDRQNAATNYYNAETQRGVALNNAFDQNLTRVSRINFMNSISHFNNTNADYVTGKNDRENKAFGIEQVQRSVNVVQSCVDLFFSPQEHVANIFSRVAGPILDMAY